MSFELIEGFPGGFKMTKLPVCVLLGSGGSNTETIIRGIFGDMPIPVTTEDKSTFYKWDITNKYYSTSIHLCTTTHEAIVNQDFTDRVNASVIYFNSSDKENGLKEAENCLSFIESCEPDIKILVADQCANDESSEQVIKTKAQQWCIKHGFELVELNSLDEPDPEDDFPETLGFERIIEALHAHSWSNLEFNRSSEGTRIDHLSSDDGGDETLDNFPLDGPTSQEMGESEADTFEELFQRMCSMKSQANTLEGAQRKAYAEKITMAFWQAIEGDGGDIEELSSPDEE